MKIFNSRIYVIRSPSLVAAVLRDSTTFTFHQFEIDFTKNAVRANKHSTDIVLDSTYLHDVQHAMHPAVSTGPGLLDSNIRILNVLSRYLKPQETNLYAFVREAYTIATGEALYGPENPVPPLIDEIWYVSHLPYTPSVFNSPGTSRMT